MAYLDNSVEYGFGQMGSGFLDDTGALTPPAGKIIVAITIVEEAKFTLLTADTAGYTASDGSTGIAYFGNGNQVDVNGANSEAIATGSSGTPFPTGITIYGRWTHCTLATGKVIVYYGQG